MAALANDDGTPAEVDGEKVERLVIPRMKRYIYKNIRDYKRIPIPIDGKLREGSIVHSLRYELVQPIVVVDLDIMPEINNRIESILFVRHGKQFENPIHYPTPGPMALFLTLVIQRCNEIYNNIDWFILNSDQLRVFFKQNSISFITDQNQSHSTGDETPYIKIDNNSFLKWALHIQMDYSLYGMPIEKIASAKFSEKLRF